MIQWKVAVEKIISTGSSTSSRRMSRRSTRTRGSPANRLLAASTIASDESTASTVPQDRCCNSNSVTRPVAPCIDGGLITPQGPTCQKDLEKVRPPARLRCRDRLVLGGVPFERQATPPFLFYLTL